MDYKLNVRRSPKDSRDWKARAIYYKVILPEVVDYRDKMQPIRDQGNQGSCAAMSGAAMKEYQEKMDIGLNEYMSPQFIYNNREDLAEEGMYMRDLMKVLKEKGDCTEKHFPYGDLRKPEVDDYIEASKYRTLNYASINTIEELKTALYINGPCIIAIPVYNYTKRLWYQNPGEELLGGHALCVVGYNTEGFIIRNSWGKDWGDNGYCAMSYADFGMQWEVWTCIDEKSINPDPPQPEKKGCLAKLFGF
jgi:hypothetical protein